MDLPAFVARALGKSAEPETELTDWLVTLFLLDEPWEYRQRVVDEVSLQTEGLYRLRRSVQLLPVREMLEDVGLVIAEGEAPAILPLALMPKSALLEFDVTGPDGKSAALVSRRETANRQTDFVLALADSAGVDTPDEVIALLFGASLFTPGMMEGPRARHRWYRPAQVAYALELAHGTPFRNAQVVEWEKSFKRTGALLAESLSAPPDATSSTENPLLALLDHPELGLTVDDITARIGAYVVWVDELVAAGATKALHVLATFGRRYVALIDTVLDPDRPALIKMTERRRLPVSSRPALGWRFIPAWRFRASIELETREARSYHLRIRTEDESIRLHREPKITSEDGEPFGANFLDGVAKSSDGYAFYTSDDERPGHIRLRIPLRTSGDVRRSLTLVAVLAGAAAAVALSHLKLDKAAIGLITLPATFSATVLLVRERTTLSARLLNFYKWSLVVAVCLLWLVSLARVTDRYPPGAAPSPSPSPSVSTAPSGGPPPPVAPSNTPTATATPSP